MLDHKHSFLLRPTTQNVCTTCDKTREQLKIDAMQEVVEIAKRVDKLVLVDFPTHDPRRHKQWAEGVDVLADLRDALDRLEAVQL